MFSQILHTASRRTYRNSIPLLAARLFAKEVLPAGWVGSVPKAIELAKKQKKPIMLVIHRHWCRACRELMPMLTGNAEVVEFSNKFVIVELTGEDDKEEESYAPDGLYVPRVLFMNSSGKLLVNIRNESNQTGTNMYVYSTPKDILTSMKKALG